MSKNKEILEAAKGLKGASVSTEGGDPLKEIKDGVQTGLDAISGGIGAIKRIFQDAGHNIEFKGPMQLPHLNTHNITGTPGGESGYAHTTNSRNFYVDPSTNVALSTNKGTAQYGISTNIINNLKKNYEVGAFVANAGNPNNYMISLNASSSFRNFGLGGEMNLGSVNIGGFSAGLYVHAGISYRGDDKSHEQPGGIKAPKLTPELNVGKFHMNSGIGINAQFRF